MTNQGDAIDTDELRHQRDMTRAQFWINIRLAADEIDRLRAVAARVAGDAARQALLDFADELKAIDGRLSSEEHYEACSFVEIEGLARARAEQETP